MAGDLHEIIMTCAILHNAVVAVRMDQNEEESNGFYESLDFEDCNDLVDCRQKRCWKSPAYHRAMLSFQIDIVQQHWQNLCDKDSHNLLRKAII